MVDPVIVLTNVATAAVSAAGAGGVVAWRKAGPENEALAVKTLREVIDGLLLDLKRKEGELRELREELVRKEGQLRELRTRTEELLHGLDNLDQADPV